MCVFVLSCVRVQFRGIKYKKKKKKEANQQAHTHRHREHAFDDGNINVCAMNIQQSRTPFSVIYIMYAYNNIYLHKVYIIRKLKYSLSLFAISISLEGLARQYLPSNITVIYLK